MSEFPAAPTATATATARPGVDPAGTIADVRAFLAGLQGEFPELFAEEAAPARPRRAGSPSDGEARVPAGEALAAVSARAEHWARRMDLRYAKVSVREMSSLWGSCSPKGNLSFNRRLLEAPPEVLDYVVVHELAHLRELNHSKRFWRIVNHFCPEHKARRKWLRREGRELLG